jgi:hypothetical protein
MNNEYRLKAALTRLLDHDQTGSDLVIKTWTLCAQSVGIDNAHIQKILEEVDTTHIGYYRSCQSMLAKLKSAQH